MLASRRIEVGKYYVNEEAQTARAVLDVEGQMVVYSSYLLGNGGLCGAPFTLCTRSEILQWADREASRDEAIHLKKSDIRAIFNESHASTSVSEPPCRLNHSFTGRWKK